MEKYIADRNIFDQIKMAADLNNPNDPATEIWDDEAIQDLANYAHMNGMVETDGIVDEILDPNNESCLAYFLYDLLKWTRANNAPIVEG